MDSDTQSIVWDAHGIEISSEVAIPRGQRVDVGIKVYHVTQFFVFPEGYSPCTDIYQIKIAAKDKSLTKGIKITLKNPQKTSRDQNICMLQASCKPTKWGANLTPVFSFHKIQDAQKIHQNKKAVTVDWKGSVCYLAIAGECISIVQ